jgi:hypothetical protein
MNTQHAPSLSNQEVDRFLPGPKVEQRYGVSNMTVWRWQRDQKIGFPRRQTSRTHRKRPKMTARGVDFLEEWIANALRNVADRTQSRQLSQKLMVDAVTARLTVSDLEIGDMDVEKYILEAMVHLAEPGTPGD